MIALTLALWTAACLQDPAPEEAGNVRFTRPKGWTRESRQGAVWLVPPGVPQGRQCSVALLPGEELKGPARDKFDHFWKALAGTAKVTGGEVETRAGDGFDVIGRTAVLEREGVSLFVTLLAFTPGKRFETVLFMTDGRDLYDQHAASVGGLVAGIGFVNLRKPAPAPVRTTLEGAWMRGAWLDDFAKGFGAKRFQVDHLFFYEGGVACRQWTSEGQDGLDVAKEMAASDKTWGWWGRRTEKEGVVTIRWANGGETEYLRKDNNSLQAGSAAPYLALASCDRLALDGLYRHGDGKPAEFGGTNYEIRFTPDGRFEESNVCAATMREGPKRGTGRYSIVNYTLYLEYDGGPRVRMGFYVVAKPESKVESVYLNTFVFSRAK